MVILFINLYETSFLDGLALFGVDDNDIWEDIRELLGVEELACLAAVAGIIYVKGLGVVAEHLLELSDIARHIHGWRIHEEEGLLRVSRVLELAAELSEIGIESKLNIEGA